MIKPPLPPDEAERLADLRALDLLDTAPEERFDRIVHLAAHAFGVPIAYIALIDAERQWFKAKCGLTTDETGRDISFCGHAILQDQALVVPDATLDDRFKDNPLVTGEPYVRFYAGHPLTGPHGHNVGTFCIADRTPRTLDDGELEQFRRLAAIAEHELNMMDLIATQHELIDTKNKLVQMQQRLTDELAEAAAYVRSLLPAPLVGSIRTDWQFVSSSQLGGDLLGYHWLDDERLAMYLLDVCGHGVSASLLSISIFNDLRRQMLPETPFDEPRQVLAALNRAFPMAAHGQKFTTIWYGVYETTSRTLRYASAGHPPALLFGPEADGPLRLGPPNLPIGVRPETSFEGGVQTIAPASRLYLFSDGIYERKAADGRMLMLEGLIDVVGRCAHDASRTGCVLERVRTLGGSAGFNDDVSILEIEFA